MLRIGLFPSFKSADTVLLAGTYNDIGTLSKLLAEAAVGKAFAVHEAAEISPRYSVELFAAATPPVKHDLW